MKLSNLYFVFGVVCIFSGTVPASQLAAEIPLNKYGATANQLTSSFVGPSENQEAGDVRFSIRGERPRVTFDWIALPRPEVTGNVTLDNLNEREMKNCLRVWKDNPIACQ